MGDEPQPDESQVEKKGGRKVLVLVVAVLLVGAVAAGAFLGPKLMSPPTAQAAPKPDPSAASPSGHQDTVAAVTTLPPIVVDARGEQGDIHHIKCTVALELKDGVSSEDVKNYTPRAREAAVSYLRQESFEALTDPKKFKTVQKELDTRIKKAVGTSRVARVVVADFVAQ
jgi:flagellar basal body-associated protein FliL